MCTNSIGDDSIFHILFASKEYLSTYYNKIDRENCLTFLGYCIIYGQFMQQRNWKTKKIYPLRVCSLTSLLCSRNRVYRQKTLTTLRFFFLFIYTILLSKSLSVFIFCVDFYFFLESNSSMHDMVLRVSLRVSTGWKTKKNILYSKY